MASSAKTHDKSHAKTKALVVAALVIVMIVIMVTTALVIAPHVITVAIETIAVLIKISRAKAVLKMVMATRLMISIKLASATKVATCRPRSVAAVEATLLAVAVDTAAVVAVVAAEVRATMVRPPA